MAAVGLCLESDVGGDRPEVCQLQGCLESDVGGDRPEVCQL